MIRSVGAILFVTVCCAGTLDCAQPEETSVCALTSDPSAYSGKMVLVRANVVTDYHGSFLADRRCKKLILLVLPEGSTMAPKIELRSDEAYRQFDSALHVYRPGTAKPKWHIQAQFTGRFEYLVPPQAGGEGRERAPAPLGAQWQLVLQSVSRVRLR